MLDVYELFIRISSCQYCPFIEITLKVYCKGFKYLFRMFFFVSLFTSMYEIKPRNTIATFYTYYSVQNIISNQYVHLLSEANIFTNPDVEYYNRNTFSVVWQKCLQGVVRIGKEEHGTFGIERENDEDDDSEY